MSYRNSEGREDFYYGMTKRNIKLDEVKEKFVIASDDIETLPAESEAPQETPAKYYNAGSSTVEVDGRDIKPGEDFPELSDRDIAKFTLNGSLGIR